jgi:hypothetical protein
VAELDKNGVPTGRVRSHATPLNPDHIVGDFGKVKMTDRTVGQSKYDLPVNKPNVPEVNFEKIQANRFKKDGLITGRESAAEMGVKNFDAEKFQKYLNENYDKPTQPIQGANGAAKLKSPATTLRVSAKSVDSRTLTQPHPRKLSGSAPNTQVANSLVNNTTLPKEMPADFLVKPQAELPLSGKGVAAPKPVKSALHSSELTDLRDNAKKGILPEANKPVNKALKPMGEQPLNIPETASKGGDLPPVNELPAHKYLFSNKVNALRATNTESW